MTEYISALMVCLQPVNLLLIVAMVSLGIVFGAIPGLLYRRFVREKAQKRRR